MRIKNQTAVETNQYLIANQNLVASKKSLEEGQKLSGVQQSSAKKLDPENLNEHLTETHKFYKGDKKEFTDVKDKDDKAQTSDTSPKGEAEGTTSGNYITREEFEGLKGPAYTGVRDGIWKEMSQDQKAGDAFSNMKADFRDLFTKLAVETSTKDKKMNPDLKKLLADDKMMQGESGNWTLNNLIEANREFKARGDDGGKMNKLLAGAAASDNPAAYIRQAINEERGIKPEPPESKPQKSAGMSKFESWQAEPGKVDKAGVKEFTDKDGNTVIYMRDEDGGGTGTVYSKDDLPQETISKIVLENGNQVYIHKKADGSKTREVVDKDGNIIADGKVYDGKTGRENFWQEIPPGAERTFPDPKLSKNLTKDDTINTYKLPGTDRFNEVKMASGTEHQVTTDKNGKLKHSVSKDKDGYQVKTRFNPDGSLKSESCNGANVTMDKFGNASFHDEDGRNISANNYGYYNPGYGAMPGYGMMPDYGMMGMMNGLGMMGMMGLGGLGMYGMMGMGGLGMYGMGGLGMMGMMGMGGLGMMGYGLGGMFGGMLGSRLGYGMGGMFGGMLGGALGWGLGGMLGGGLGMGLGRGMFGGMGMGWGGLGMGMMGMGGLGMMGMGWGGLGMGSWGLGMGMGLDGGMTMAGMGMAGLGDIYANGMLGW